MMYLEVLCTLIITIFCTVTDFKNSKADLCSSKSDFNDLSGKYVKSICEVLKPSNYYDAELACRNAGMELFVVDSTDIQTVLFKFSRHYRVEAFWINGRRDNFQPWSSYTPKKNPIFPGLSWSAKITTAQCLSIIRSSGKIEAVPHVCDQVLNFYCEYRRI